MMPEKYSKNLRKNMDSKKYRMYKKWIKNKLK